MAGMMSGDWKRLASYVVARRVKLGFKDRPAFSDATGITERTLGNLENGKSVSATTLAAVADALRWSPDSPNRILRGGEPVQTVSSAAPGGDMPETSHAPDPGALVRWFAVQAAGRGYSVSQIGELAQSTGLSQWTADRYSDSSGNFPLPDARMLAKMGGVLGMAAADILVASGLLPGPAVPLQPVPSLAAEEA